MLQNLAKDFGHALLFCKEITVVSFTISGENRRGSEYFLLFVFWAQVFDFCLAFFPGNICLVFATVWN